MQDHIELILLYPAVPQFILNIEKILQNEALGVKDMVKYEIKNLNIVKE